MISMNYFTLKIEAGYVSRVVKPIFETRNDNDICMNALLFLTSTYLEPQKLVSFELEVYSINNRTCK